jgi:hypothetical protein
VRGDVGTVRAHLAELTRFAAREPRAGDIPASYRALARASVQRALAAGRLREDQAAAVLDAIDKG